MKLSRQGEKKSVLEADQMTAENIYRILINFERLYAIMDERKRRKLLEALIAEIQIYEETKKNGQWLKSIRFRLPIIPEYMVISLDNGD